MRWLKRILTPPLFEDQGKTFAARLLHPILLSTIVFFVPVIPMVVLFAPEAAVRFGIGALFSLAMSFSLLWLERRGQVRMASMLLVTILWIILTSLVVTGAGVRAPAFLTGYLPIIMIAGLLLGGWVSALLAAGSIMVGLALILLESLELWQPAPQLPVRAVWALAAFLFSVVVVVQSLSARIRREALDKAQEELLERRQAEEKINQLNAQLEQRVQERTAELEAANKELSAFAYSVSHDLRAPLRSLDGYSSILQEECREQLTPEYRGYLDRIRENAQKMGELIDSLLAFSRLGRQPLNKQLVQMKELARQALEELAGEISPQQVKIVVGKLPDCEADPVLLRNVLVNLLSNAFKYSSMRRPARVEVGWQDGAYFVRDNGIGFDMRFADQLFSVFQRLHPMEEYPGHGIGLAIVQRIIQRHGGQVWAEAQVDRGATFYFSLDCRKPEKEPEIPG